MKQVTVGTYEFGLEMVQVVLREDNGGEFWFLPGDIHWPRIKVGADQETWPELVSVLAHEAMEFAFARVGLRYCPAEAIERDHGAYLFVANHVQFAEATSHAGDFMARCLPDVSAAWKKWHQKKKPRAARKKGK